MNNFRLLKTRSLTKLLSFLVGALLFIACHPRLDQSKVTANEQQSGNWCGGIKEVIANFAKSCGIGQESDDLCAQFSNLPMDLSCQSFSLLIKDSLPSKRIAILKKFNKMQRAYMGKDLAFLIPQDVKPRIPELAYVDAYITAVDRVTKLEIPKLDTPDSRIVNNGAGIPDFPYVFSYVRLDGERFAFGMCGNIKVIDYKLKTEIDFYYKGCARGIFKWKGQFCAFEIGIREIPVQCFSNLDDPKAKSLVENKDASFSIFIDNSKNKFIYEYKAKVLDDKVFLLPKFSSNNTLFFIDMEKKTATKVDGLTPDQYVTKFKMFQNGIMLSEFPPLEVKGTNFSELTSLPILENLYLGVTGISKNASLLAINKNLVAIEKKENGDLVVLKKSKFVFCRSPFVEEVEPSLYKLTGGYIVYETDSRLMLYDIWAPTK
jgi:hypothetical protein